MKRLNVMVISALLGVVAPGDQSKLANAILQAEQDLRKDTGSLVELREQINQERVPLAGQVSALQQEVGQRRAQVDSLRDVRRKGQEELRQLRDETKALETELGFLADVFSEYARSAETRVNAAEGSILGPQLDPLAGTLSRQSEPGELATAVQTLLEISATWNEQRFGGNLFSGRALDESGMEHEGVFAVAGPLSWFQGSGSGPAGIAVTRFGSDRPGLFSELDSESLAAISQLVDGRQAWAPIDVTGGDAIKVEEAKGSLIDHVREGGLVIIPLLVIGALALVISLVKLIELSRINVVVGDLQPQVIACLKTGEVDQARALAGKIASPLRELVMESIEHRNLSREHLEELMHERVLGMLPGLERNLGTLAVFGGVAPLLGLLGTVTGMIHTFELVTLFGSGDAKLLSGGISEALVTTEFGLIIAIPILLVHAFLTRRVRSIVSALERTSVSLVNDIHVRADQG